MHKIEKAIMNNKGKFILNNTINNLIDQGHFPLPKRLLPKIQPTPLIQFLLNDNLSPIENLFCIKIELKCHRNIFPLNLVN